MSPYVIHLRGRKGPGRIDADYVSYMPGAVVARVPTLCGHVTETIPAAQVASVERIGAPDTERST
jgi:hypothetical protein